MPLYYVATKPPERPSPCRNDARGAAHIFVGKKSTAKGFIKENDGMGYKLFRVKFVEVK